MANAGDVILEDSPKNLEMFNGITIAMDKEYNRHVKVDYRVYDWLEYEKIIKMLEQRV